MVGHHLCTFNTWQSNFTQIVTGVKVISKHFLTEVRRTSYETRAKKNFHWWSMTLINISFVIPQNGNKTFKQTSLKHISLYNFTVTDKHFTLMRFGPIACRYFVLRHNNTNWKSNLINVLKIVIERWKDKNNDIPEGQSWGMLQVTALPCSCKNLCTPTFFPHGATCWQQDINANITY